jgi:hypothetical protein
MTCTRPLPPLRRYAASWTASASLLVSAAILMPVAYTPAPDQPDRIGSLRHLRQRSGKRVPDVEEVELPEVPVAGVERADPMLSEEDGEVFTIASDVQSSRARRLSTAFPPWIDSGPTGFPQLVHSDAETR